MVKADAVRFLKSNLQGRALADGHACVDLVKTVVQGTQEEDWEMDYHI